MVNAAGWIRQPNQHLSPIVAIDWLDGTNRGEVTR